MTRTSWPVNGPLGTFTPEKSARLERESQAKALAGVKFYREGGAAELQADIDALAASNARDDAEIADVACWGCGRLVPVGFRLCPPCVASDETFAAFEAAEQHDWYGMFRDRHDELIQDARSLDDDWEHLGLSLAADGLDAVEALFPPPTEDDEPFMRFACLIWAMQRALDEARDDYAESRPHPSRSGWSAEAFPKAVLGL